VKKHDKKIEQQAHAYTTPVIQANQSIERIRDRDLQEEEPLTKHTVKKRPTNCTIDRIN
jgi:hypothetical protein